ncbi:MAG: hypothetical protein JO038_07240 [Alphaproteobacteria bacterium]|nr:hypothetical protein [Alphaproteobacteria bacterium]
MSFISGFLGLCSAVALGTATEVMTPGYSRQPISFDAPRLTGLDEGLPAGSMVVSRNSRAWSFGALGAGPLAGRAIYDAPTGGQLLLVLPYGSGPRPAPMNGPVDSGQPGDISLIFSGVQPLGDAAEAWSGTYPAGAVIGTCFDTNDIAGRSVVTGGRYGLVFSAGAMSVGSVPQIFIAGGRLMATDRWPI